MNRIRGMTISILHADNDSMWQFTVRLVVKLD